MPKKKGSVRCIIQYLGLFYLAHPDVVEDTWRSSYAFGAGATTPYSTSRIDTNGRIRVSVAGKERLNALKDSAIPVSRYETNTFSGRSEVAIMESVVETTICYNLAFAEILWGKEPTRESRLKTLIFESNQPSELTAQIKTAFREDFFHGSWKQSNSAYLFAFVILVVDDLSLFHEKFKELNPNSLTDIDNSVTIYALPEVIDDFLPYLGGISGLPLQLLVIENRESIDWIESGTIPKKQNDAYSKAILVGDYLLHRFRLDLIDWQINWINSRCKDLLETVPKDTPQTITAREERLQQLIDTSMNLDFYYISHLMAKDFIIREEEQEDTTDSVSEFILSKPIIRERLALLEDNLTQLKQSLQTRVNLESLLVEKHKEEQQARTEQGLNILQLYFAAFVIFELAAAYMAWALDSNFFLSHPAWWLILFGAAFSMLYGIRIITQKKRVETKDNVSIFLKCPNCSAGYWYDKSKIGSNTIVSCQNCMKTFAV